MRFRSVRALLLVAAACLPVPPSAEGQETDAPPPPKLSIRVVQFEGSAPSFYPVGDEHGAGMGAIIRSFRRLPPPRWSTFPQVDDVRLSFSREGARVRVGVYVHAEKEPLAEDTKVAECVLDEGQECAPAGLLSFGVEPLRLGLVRRGRAELSPPRVDNRTRAIEVTSVEVREKGPTFELGLRNASDKSIRAIEIKEMRGRQSKGSPPHFDWKSMSLIEPGKSWKVTLEFGWNFKTNPDGHAVEPPDRVVIDAVLFSDGSYEGNSTFAARAEAFKSGRRAQLGRVLDIMREAGEWPGADLRDVARELGIRVGMLDCTADWSAVVELAGRYPSLPYSELESIKRSVEEGMDWQRAAVLGELKACADAPAPQTYRPGPQTSLKALRERYEKWLAGI